MSIGKETEIVMLRTDVSLIGYKHWNLKVSYSFFTMFLVLSNPPAGTIYAFLFFISQSGGGGGWDNDNAKCQT